MFWKYAANLQENTHTKVRKGALQLYWNRTSAWVFSWTLLHIFRKSFPRHNSVQLLLNFHIHIFRFATQHWYCISDRFSWHSKSSRPNVFCKKAVQESFAESIEKHLCLSLFLIKVQTSSLQFYLTEAPVFSSEFWEIFKNTFFVEVLRATASRSKCQFCI